MRVMVTGANGFVGRHLVPHLTVRGHQVIPVSGPEEGHNAVDLTNPASVQDLVNRHHPEAIIHLAAQSSVGRSWKDPADTVNVNVLGTLHLWQAATARDLQRFIYISTAEVYDPLYAVEHVLTENAPLRPANPYGTSKLAAEMLLRQVSPGSTTELVILRPFNHVGSGQATGFVISDLVAQIRKQSSLPEPFLRVGNLTAIRDFLDVRDVAKAYAAALEHPSLEGAYNICSGSGRSIQSVLDNLLACTHLDFDIEIDATLLRPVDTPRLVGDPSHFRSVTGWMPHHSWEETMQYVLGM